jgi:hypothetical protein
MSEEFAVVLTDESVITTFPGMPESVRSMSPRPDPEKNQEAEKQLEQAISDAGGTRTRDEKYETHSPINKKGGPFHYPADTYTTTVTTTYVCGSLTMLLVFLHAALSALKGWQDLKSSRYVKVKVGDKIIQFEGGDDLVTAVQNLARDIQKEN